MVRKDSATHRSGPGTVPSNSTHRNGPEENALAQKMAQRPKRPRAKKVHWANGPTRPKSGPMAQGQQWDHGGFSTKLLSTISSNAKHVTMVMVYWYLVGMISSIVEMK